MSAKAVISIYQEMREVAREIANTRLQAQADAGLLDDRFKLVRGAKIVVTGIDAAALLEWQHSWANHPQRAYDWDWSHELRGWATTLKRTDAAIWADDQLCALMIGCVTKGRKYLRVDLLEGSPDSDHPLKGRVAYCASEIAIAMGTIFGCSHVVFLRPIDAAIPLYERLGFSLATNEAKVRMCVKAI